jgi:competence protein ComEC
MVQRFHVPFWKAMPCIRLLPPFIAGIALQWYMQFSFSLIAITAVCFVGALLLFSFLPLSVRFKVRPLQGAIIYLMTASFGLLVTWKKDVRHHQDWYGNHYKDSACLIVRIDEPLVEKSKSYKAEGSVEAIIKGDTIIKCQGKLLLYFSIDSSLPQLHYGDKILVNKELQPIKNSGNPGAFNYQRYAAFQQIFHNVFLKDKDYVLLNDKNNNLFRQFIFSARQAVLDILQKNITNGKDELGIAEALLIGYTNDLDKDLVQAYSNTGVVHIIAISGMHLALIYVMLVWIFSRIPFVKRSKVLQLILVLSCLWLFSLLTGGSASVLRSAVMFSFIKTGQTFSKRSSVYNSLAASAFVMLCYDPYYLWNVGFQLSYLAVIGILLFQKPVYNRIYIKNKWLDKIWQMTAVTIAAQVLTFPVCIYYFHQFPVLFLITNLIAVPLSTVVLYAELLLMAFSWVPFIGTYAGKLVQLLVWVMNKFITGINALPFAAWDNIPASVLSTSLLYCIVLALSVWLLNKNKGAFKTALVFLLIFTIVQTYAKWQVKQQQKFIVYNVPKYRAIDIIEGNRYRFIGDSILLKDGVLQNFHLKPARIALQLSRRTDSLASIAEQQNFLLVNNKRILLLSEPLLFDVPGKKTAIDIIVLSKNPKISIAQLSTVFNCGQYVFDASNSLYRINKWEKECDALHLPYYVVSEKGAFVYDTK